MDKNNKVEKEMAKLQGRIPLELKELLDAHIKANGLKSQDFIAQLVQSYFDKLNTNENDINVSSEIGNIQANFSSILSQIESIVVKTNNYSEEIKSSKVTLSTEKDKEIAELKNKISLFEEQNIHLRESNKKLEESISLANEKEDEIRNKYTDVVENLDRTTKHEKILFESKKELENENEKLKKDLNQIVENYSVLEKIYSSLEERQKDLLSTFKENFDLKLELSLEKALFEKQKEFDEKIKDLKATHESDVKIINSLEEEKREIKSELEDLKNLKIQDEKMIKSLKEDVESLRNQLKDPRNRIFDLNQK